MRMPRPFALPVLTLFGLAGPFAAAAEMEYGICNDYLPPPRSIDDLPVGPESCLMLAADVEYLGRTFTRIDMGLDGTAEGYVTMDGTYHEYLTNSPQLIFEQAGTPGERLLAIARYERMRGTAILLMLPQEPEAWNGRLFVTAHGRGRSFRNGRLKIWNRYYDPDDPMGAFDGIERVMLEKGYALAVTNRTSEQDIGEVIATLGDGTVIDFAAFNDNAQIIKDMTRVAEAMVADRLGRAPDATFLYGHSAGARIARSINYSPGLNEVDGEPVFDGFLMDDSATGLWFPVVMRDGEDVLFTTDEEKASFRPQVELVHQLYTKVWERAPDRKPWITRGYLTNKRINAKILFDKGLGDRFRMYEIRSISHSGGEAIDPDYPSPKVRLLNISLVIGGAIDKLESLAAGDPDTLASKSDWEAIGDVDGDGIIDNPAIIYPEVACPLGVFYPYPENGGYLTAWAGFTGEGLEPLDEAQVFVDMNRNGVWDFRETPTRAWQRLGLLQPGEALTHDRYVDCMIAATTILVDEGFFTPTTAARYVEEARVRSIDPADLVE